MTQTAPRHRDEAGFTLIELMVVVLIIGILIAIALPTFFGARKRGQDKQAQSDLRVSHAAARVCYTDNDAFTGCDGLPGTPMTQIEPSLTFVDTGVNSTGPKVISVDVVNAIVWVAAAYSDSKTCFAVKDTINGVGIQYATVTGACNATNANATGVFTSSW